LMARRFIALVTTGMAVLSTVVEYYVISSS
jgi:hypothetical protein